MGLCDRSGRVGGSFTFQPPDQAPAEQRRASLSRNLAMPAADDGNDEQESENRRRSNQKQGPQRMVKWSSPLKRTPSSAILPLGQAGALLVQATLIAFSAHAAQAERAHGTASAEFVAEAAPQPGATDATQGEKKEKEGTPATVVDGKQLESVLGISAVSSAGEDMGRIVDIIVDRGGQVRAAIIDFGGFIGVGSRKIAVDWGTIHFLPKGKADTVEVDLTKDQLRVAPVYKPGEPVVVIGHSEEKP
jgi:hypothetical protein